MGREEVWECEAAKILDWIWGLFCLWCLKDIQVEMRKGTTRKESQKFKVLLLKILTKCLVSDIIVEQHLPGHYF